MALDLKKVRENYENKSKGGGDKWKAQKGDNAVRVLPHSMDYFTGTVDDIAYLFLLHFNVGPEGAKQAVVCPKTLDRKNRCPICEASAMLRKSEDLRDQALGSDLSYRRRFLLNLIDMKDAETISKGIQAFECGPKVYEGIIQWCNEKWGDPLDLETGRNLIIVKTIPASGDIKRTEYKVEPDPNKTSIVDHLPPNWKEQVASLAALVPKVLSYDEIKKVLEGEVDYGNKKSDIESEVEGEEVVGGPAQTKETTVIKDEEKPKTAETATGKKDCYGKLFSGRSEKCVACGDKEPCKCEFLKP